MTYRARRFVSWMPAIVLIAAMPLGWYASTAQAEERKFAVLLLDLRKDAEEAPDPLYNPDDVRDSYFDREKDGQDESTPRVDSFAEWWEEVSYGEVTVSGDVFGWFQLPWPSAPEDWPEEAAGYNDVIPHIELQGGFSFNAFQGESFTPGISKYQYDMDGVGASEGLNRGPDDFDFILFQQRTAHEDEYGLPFWSPGERFQDLNGNRVYDAGVWEWGIDKNGNGRIDVDRQASSWAELISADITFPDDEDPEGTLPEFNSWSNNTEWFDSNGDGEWDRDGLESQWLYDIGPLGETLYRGDWGGTEIWWDKDGDGGESEPTRAASEGGEGDDRATFYDFIIQVHDPDSDVEYFDEQWNDSFDYPEPFEDYLRRWGGSDGPDDFIPVEEEYILANFPGDAQVIVDQAGNGRYNAPDAWSNVNNTANSNKLQEVSATMLDGAEAAEQRRRFDRRTPRPESTNTPWSLDEFWESWFGTEAPDWRSSIPYMRRFNPTQPIPPTQSNPEPIFAFEPNGGGPFNTGQPYSGGSFSGTVLPNPSDGRDGFFDGNAEYADLPSSIYHSGAGGLTAGDFDFGEITGKAGTDMYGADQGTHNPNGGSGTDGVIPAAGPLAYNVHGEGGYDGGNVMNTEYLTWRRDGLSLADREVDFDGDGVIDFKWYRRDVNLDGLLDMGESPGENGQYGIPTPRVLHSYTVDFTSSSKNDGRISSTYPFNKLRLLEDAIAAADDTVDWDNFIGGSGEFGGIVQGVLLLSQRTYSDLYVRPTVVGYHHPIRTRDLVDPSVEGVEKYTPIPFWDGIGIAVQAGGGPEVIDPFQDGLDFQVAFSCHEYGHRWEGYPDLYDKDVFDPGGIVNYPIGRFCIMSNDFKQHPVPILKSDSGWITPVDITRVLAPGGSTQIEIPAWEFERDQVVFRYQNPLFPGEQFWFWRNSPGIIQDGDLIQQSFNIRQPGHGVMIMHVDLGDNPEGVPQQQRIGSHFTYNIVQADGLQQMDNGENTGDAGDPWPGATGSTQWNATSDPDNKWWSGQSSGLSISAIEELENSSVVTFRWTPRELPTFSWIQPPGGVSINGVYALRYQAFDQFGGTRIRFFAIEDVRGEELTWEGIPLPGFKDKSPGDVTDVYQATVRDLPDGTYRFYAQMQRKPGGGSDGNIENLWSVPRASISNQGTGELTVDGVDPDISKLATWTVECVDASTPRAEQWRVQSQVSGRPTNIEAGLAVTGSSYTSDNGEVEFTIASGQIPYGVGDQFTFVTTGLTPFSEPVLVFDGEVVAPQPPDAVAEAVSTTTGLAPLTVTFVHSGSTDPRNAPLDFEWDFGDGSDPFVTSTLGVPVAHEYIAPGNYTATLTVTNSFGLSDTDTVPVGVSEALAPEARATVAPVEGAAPLVVQFSGELSSDPNDGTQGLDYVWDFGDGSSPVADVRTTHTYDEPGIYLATLTVTNRPYNKSSVEVVEIRVTGVAGDQAPVAQFRVDRLFGQAPLTVLFEGDEAYDPEGGPLEYTWNFGDGSPIVRGASVVEHTYTRAQSYTATLTVTDDGGQSDSAAITIVVTGDDKSNNSSPVARIMTSTRQGPAPLTVTFDGGNSSDPEGGNLSFAWDFGDGTDQVEGEVVAHTYTEPREYTAVLVVADASGATGAASVRISVTSPAGDDAAREDPDAGQDTPDGPVVGGCGTGCGPIGLMPIMLTLVGIGGLRRMRGLYRS